MKWRAIDVTDHWFGARKKPFRKPDVKALHVSFCVTNSAVESPSQAGTKKGGNSLVQLLAGIRHMFDARRNSVPNRVFHRHEPYIRELLIGKYLDAPQSGLGIHDRATLFVGWRIGLAHL